MTANEQWPWYVRWFCRTPLAMALVMVGEAFGRTERTKSMTTDPKPVTEAELAEWERKLDTMSPSLARSAVSNDRYSLIVERDLMLRLIAAVREARMLNQMNYELAETLQAKLADTEARLLDAKHERDVMRKITLELEAKLAEIRAVVNSLTKEDLASTATFTLRKLRRVAGIK